MSPPRPLAVLSAALALATAAGAAPRVIVRETAGDVACLGAAVLAARLVAHRQPATVDPGTPLAAASPGTLVAWLSRDEGRVLLHVAGEALGTWERALPAGSCETQREAAAMAVLSLLDPLGPEDEPSASVPPKAALATPAPPPSARRLLGVLLAASLLSDGRPASAVRLVGTPLPAPVELEFGYLHEAALAVVPGGVRTTGLDAALLFAPRPSVAGPYFRPRLGLALAMVRLDAAEVAGHVARWFARPELMGGVEAGRCGEPGCVSAALVARLALAREALRAGSLGVVGETATGEVELSVRFAFALD